MLNLLNFTDYAYLTCNFFKWFSVNITRNRLITSNFQYQSDKVTENTTCCSYDTIGYVHTYPCVIKPPIDNATQD